MSTRELGEINEETSDTESNTMGGEPQESIPDTVDKKKRKRRPPLVPWKKPKDMPRRPLSAYNIFFKEQRETMMALVAAAEKAAADANTNDDNTESEAEVSKPRTRKRSNKSVGIGFANLARTIAANWKEMDDEARAPYESSAATEKGRYKEEMLVWRAKQKKDKDTALAVSRQDADNQASSPYPSGLLDSSGETSMDDSHTGTVASAPSAFAMHPSSSAPGSRHGPIPVGSMDVDSPKRTRITYQHHGEIIRHGGNTESDITPIRLSDMQGRWSYDPRSHSYPFSMDQWNRSSGAMQQHHNVPLHSSLSRLDAFQSTQNIMDANGRTLPSFLSDPGMVAMPPFNRHSDDSVTPGNHHLDPYHFAQACNTNQESIIQEQERRFIMQEHHVMQQQRMIHQHQGHQYMHQDESFYRHDNLTRRNSWSGVPDSAPQLTKLSSRDCMEPDMGMMMHSSLPPITPTLSQMSNSSNIPDSWLEPETSIKNYSITPTAQTDSASSQQILNAQNSKLYPDAWFEVGEAETPAIRQESHREDELMRYSPDGDLTGKLPVSSASGIQKHSPSTSPLKQDRQGNRKVEEHFQPTIRTVDQVSGSCNSHSIAPPFLPVANIQEVSSKPSYSPESFVESSSLQALGMQFDEETMDFLARLRHDSTHGNPARTGDSN